MAEGSLAEAFDRLGVRPLPSVEELKGMTPEERQAAFMASSVSAEQYEQLPAWYRDGPAVVGRAGWDDLAMSGPQALGHQTQDAVLPLAP